MRRILGWICMLGAVLALSSAAGEGRAYSDVLAEWKDIPPASSAAAVPLDGALAENVGLTREKIGGEDALCWRTGLGSVTFPFTAPQRGLYCLSVRYTQLDGSSGQIERGVMINGAYPFAECASFLFPKQFEDALYPFARNEYGNEIRPRQDSVSGQCRRGASC